MSHGIIIRSGRYAEPGTASEASTADYEFEFFPAHDLPEAVIDKRVAKIRRVLNKLTQDVTAPGDEDED